MSRRRTRSGGAIAALSRSETRKAQGPSIEPAGTGSCRLTFAVLVLAFAALGLFAYAAMLVCAVHCGEGAVVSGVFVALIGALFSAYLTYLEPFVLRATCQWCMASVLLVIAYLVLGALRLRDAGSDVPETAGGR
jgi:uncharacterized membrane protein